MQFLILVCAGSDFAPDIETMKSDTVAGSTRSRARACARPVHARTHLRVPCDEAAASGCPEAGSEEPRAESVPWLEPFPGPHDELEQRETVELAFVAVLQHLAPN